MKIKERHKAIKLRKSGHSLKEIAKNLDVAKSSVSMWVRDVKLSPVAERRLLTKIKLGQFNAAKNKKAQTAAIENKYLQEAMAEIKKMDISENYAKLLCAVIYWCEGAKSNKSGINFVNSDPKLVSSFLDLLRASFLLDERKFRPCIHLHSYHNPQKQLDFWSKMTDINKKQFTKPYLKPNTGKRIHDDYQGCIAIRYHSNDLARRINSIAKAFLEMGT
ncbi:MAG: helix-turn-helix domain-containing protein [Patescibacteria group bacterium]